MSKVPLKIENLIRTNMALVLLCIISIGILFLVMRSSDDDKGSNQSQSVKNLSVEPTPATGDDLAIGSDPMAQLPESSPLKHAPTPATFRSFTFRGEVSVDVSFQCTDTYNVALIYPLSIDYRLNPMSALYNRATPCVMNASSTEVVSLVDRPFQASSTYYIVRAHQGKQGTWHDPY